MTLPYERTRAVIQTEKFLRDLCDPKITPRVPAEMRRQAKSLIRHYPNQYEMTIISKREDSTVDRTLKLQIFGEIQ